MDVAWPEPLCPQPHAPTPVWLVTTDDQCTQATEQAQLQTESVILHEGAGQPRPCGLRRGTALLVATEVPHDPHMAAEAGSDPCGHFGVTWGVYLCAGKPPLADIILSYPPDLTRCDSVIGLAIPAMSGHIQYRGTASGDLYIGISGINRVFLS